ncbi:MAG: hypothetical protein ABFE13_09765 [Phycisphaerales bacterium]
MTTDRSHNTSAPRRYALTAAPFLIGAAALYNWVIAPHVGYLHAMQRLEPVITRMAEELDAVDETRDEKLSMMRGLRAELANVREGLFTSQEAKAFTHDLPTVVGKTGCVIGAVDFSQDARETDDPNTPIAVEALHADCTIVGQYGQIVALLRSFREQRQRVWVDSCQMDLLDPRTGRLECRLGLTIYIALQPGELRS